MHSGAKYAFVCIAALSIVVAGCSTKSSRTVGDLVEHFRESGFEGTFKPNFAGMMGAEEGGNFEDDEFLVVLYRFENESRADSLEKSGMSGYQCYKNGSFIMIGDDSPDGLISAFKDW